MKLLVRVMLILLLVAACTPASPVDEPIEEPILGDTYFITDEMVDAIDFMVEDAKVHEGFAKIYNAFIVERTYDNQLHIMFTGIEPDLKFYYEGTELKREVIHIHHGIVKYQDEVMKEASVTIMIDVLSEDNVTAHVRTPDGYALAYFDVDKNTISIDKKESSIILNQSLHNELTKHILTEVIPNDQVKKLRQLSSDIEKYLLVNAELMFKNEIDSAFYRSERDHKPRYEEDEEPFRIEFVSQYMNNYNGKVDTFDEFVVSSLLFAVYIDKPFASPEEIDLTLEMLDSFLYMSPCYSSCVVKNESYECYSNAGDGKSIMLPKGMREIKEGYFIVVKEEDYLDTIQQVLGITPDIDYSLVEGLKYDEDAKVMLMEIHPSEVAIPDVPYFVVDSIIKDADSIRFVGYRYSHGGFMSSYIKDKEGNLYVPRLTTYRTIQENSKNFEQWEFALQDLGGMPYRLVSGKIIN